MSKSNQFSPRNSLEILSSYTHPKYEGVEGQGVYVMYSKSGSFSWCPSGNELKRVYEQDPKEWLSGPIWLPLSKEDYDRIMNDFKEMCENF